MKTNTKAVGERTEGFILAKLLQLGHSVSMPFGDNQRYDMILDEEGKLSRCQCKTARILKGNVVFDVASNNWHRGTRHSYHGQVDMFLVYCPPLNKFYRVPIAECGKTTITLRLDPTKNRRSKGIRFASNFEF